MYGADLRPWAPVLRASSMSFQSAKEAMTQRYGRSAALGLTTQSESVYEPGTGAGNSGGFVVVQSGGSVHEEMLGPTEIPPVYDSIPTDDRGR